MNISVGAEVVLPAQQASIYVTLGEKLLTVDYDSPGSICSIPNAGRNVGLVFGVFVALLLVSIVAIELWQNRKQASETAGVLSKLNLLVIPTLLKHSKLHGVRQLMDQAWVFASDVVYFIYSQVTDAVTVHQVF